MIEGVGLGLVGRVIGREDVRVRVIRQNWPIQSDGQYRWDIRIEPKPEAAVTPPHCDQCGHVTVRRGEIFVCLNCGNEMKPGKE